MTLSLTPTDRLDFSLPDFTRISWVSEHACQIWEPRLESIRRAWFHIEWLSVLAGVLQCSLTGLSLKEFINATALWTGHGLSALPLQIEGASNLTYSNTARTPE